MDIATIKIFAVRYTGVCNSRTKRTKTKMRENIVFLILSEFWIY